MFNIVLVQDSLICDDVGLWNNLNKGGDRIYDIDIGLQDILEGIVSNNQVVPSDGAPIVYFIIVVDGGMIP